MGALLLTFLFYIWQELRDKRQREGLSIESAAEICGVDSSTWGLPIVGTKSRNRKIAQKGHFF